MKILSLTEDQFMLLKNQYEDELELALKYVDDIRAILMKLNRQEGKVTIEKKIRKRRKSKKAGTNQSGVVSKESVKAVAKGKKRGRKPKAVVAESAPVRKTRKKKAKPGPKPKGTKVKAEKKATPAGKKSQVKARPVIKKKAAPVRSKPLPPLSAGIKSPVKTYISPEVKKEE